MANKIYAEEVELPVITICHHKHSLRAQSQFGLDWDDFKAGKLLPDNANNVSHEDVFEAALDEHYHLLDITGTVFTFLAAKQALHFGISMTHSLTGCPKLAVPICPVWPKLAQNATNWARFALIVIVQSYA